ncbi:MAG: hypothetical protein U0835_20060 [Isosphaeraceae bacterium]
MSIFLVARNGGKAGEPVEVRGGLVRVGGDPACGLRVDGMEPHVATLEVRDDGCRVHNRTHRPLRLEGRPIAPGRPVAWPLGARLELAPGVEVALVDEDDLTSAALESSAADTTAAPSAATRAADRGAVASSWARPERLVPLMLLCLATWITVRTLRLDEQAPVEAAQTDNLTELVHALRGCGEDGRLAAQAVQLALQADRQGRPAVARARLIRLRDWLNVKRRPDGTFPEPLQPMQRLHSWVVRALGPSTSA